jgi:hypothetical protein
MLVSEARGNNCQGEQIRDTEGTVTVLLWQFNGRARRGALAGERLFWIFLGKAAYCPTEFMV